MSNAAEDMQARAVEIVAGFVTTALADEENQGLEWLPRDFAERIIELAWKHQFDPDATRFRGALRRYLELISRVEGGGQE